MQKSYYNTVRENIKIDNGFTDKDVEDNSIIWSTIMNDMNDKVLDHVSALRNSKLSEEDIEVACLTDEFKTILQKKNKNNILDLFDDCKLTKPKTLLNLFTKPDDKRKDFHPKTKDFFALYCGRNGWRDFLADERGDINILEGNEPHYDTKISSFQKKKEEK